MTIANPRDNNKDSPDVPLAYFLFVPSTEWKLEIPFLVSAHAPSTPVMYKPSVLESSLENVYGTKLIYGLPVQRASMAWDEPNSTAPGAFLASAGSGAEVSLHYAVAGAWVSGLLTDGSPLAAQQATFDAINRRPW